jgi:hypothetical protein
VINFSTARYEILVRGVLFLRQILAEPDDHNVKTPHDTTSFKQRPVIHGDVSEIFDTEFCLGDLELRHLPQKFVEAVRTDSIPNTL